MGLDNEVRALWDATVAALARQSAVGRRRSAVVYQDLAQRYAESGRHYHTLEHVADCLRHVAALGAGRSERPLLELAVWFHDAVYDPRRRDNEVQSAALARRQLEAWALETGAVERVCRLIGFTAGHEAPAGDAGAAVLLDADLAILGATADRYDAYAQAIRREYAYVPDDAYARGRRAVLERFLARETIYQTDGFRAARESRARANLAREARQYRSSHL